MVDDPLAAVVVARVNVSAVVAALGGKGLEARVERIVSLVAVVRERMVEDCDRV